MTDNNKPYFVTSKNFHGDNDYIEWLKEIKNCYQNIRNRVALQANYGALPALFIVALCKATNVVF